MRRAEGSGDGMIDERRARRNNLAHDVVGRADNQGWNTARFDDVSDETDGLMAERSIRDQQGEVHIRRCQLGGERGRKLTLDFLVPAHPAHER